MEEIIIIKDYSIMAYIPSGTILNKTIGAQTLINGKAF